MVSVWVPGRGRGETVYNWLQPNEVYQNSQQSTSAGSLPCLLPSQTHSVLVVSTVLTLETDRQHETGRRGQWWLGIFPEARRAGFGCLVSASDTSGPRDGFPVISFHQRAWSQERWLQRNFSSLSVFGLKLCETVKANIMFLWKTINSFGFGSRRFAVWLEERWVCRSQVINCTVLEFESTGRAAALMASLMPGSRGWCSLVTAHDEDRELTWSLSHTWQLLPCHHMEQRCW